MAQDLIDRLHRKEEEFIRLIRITEQLNLGVMLEEVLDRLFDEARSVIPYDRLGLSLIDSDRGMVVARWARWTRSERPSALTAGYEAPLQGSSLEQIMQTGQPRIINDLEAYLRDKPTSVSTQRILQDGMLSSLTCPLIVQGHPVGFVFFSSIHKDTYSNVHVAFFQQIVGHLAIIVEKSRLYGELAAQKAVIENQNRAMTRDLELARRVQQALIPNEIPEVPGLEIAFAYEPVDQIGGDLLDIIPVGDHQVVFFVGDAVGHGVSAALVMSVVKAALYLAVQSDPQPASVIASINKTVARLIGDYFVTALCCLLDTGRRCAQLAVAGHPAPLRFRASTGEVATLEVCSELPLGLEAATGYRMTTLELEAGDGLIFFTDGLIEAFDPTGNQYGDDRLRSQVLRHGNSRADDICSRIRHDQQAHCDRRPLQDDLTLLVVKLTGPKSKRACGNTRSR